MQHFQPIPISLAHPQLLLVFHPASLPVLNRNFLLCRKRNFSLCCDSDGSGLEIRYGNGYNTAFSFARSVYNSGGKIAVTLGCASGVSRFSRSSSYRFAARTETIPTGLWRRLRDCGGTAWH